MSMWANIQDEGLPQEAVGKRTSSSGVLPFRSALDQRDDRVKTLGSTMSDLQLQMMNEQKQHEDSYIYQNGSNQYG